MMEGWAEGGDDGRRERDDTRVPVRARQQEDHTVLHMTQSLRKKKEKKKHLLTCLFV